MPLLHLWTLLLQRLYPPFGDRLTVQRFQFNNNPLALMDTNKLYVSVSARISLMSGGPKRQHTSPSIRSRLQTHTHTHTQNLTFRLFSLAAKRVTNHDKFGDAAKGCGKNHHWPTYGPIVVCSYSGVWQPCHSSVTTDGLRAKIRTQPFQHASSAWGLPVARSTTHTQTPIQWDSLFAQICGGKSKYCITAYLFTDFHGRWVTVM
jgi:hypothetical protein